MSARRPQGRGASLRNWQGRAARFAIAACAAVASASVLAWPTQTITLVVPYGPGTGVDILARQFAARLPAALGQPVVVENVPGAAGTIGTEGVARAKPDGHTLLVQSLSFAMGRSLYKSIRYDPIADFAPISLVAWSSYVLVVPASSPSRSVAELFAAAAATPGRLTYATPGVGTVHHVATELVLQKANVTMLHVPYKTSGAAVADVLAGRIDAALLPLSVVLPHVQSGRFVALATGSPKRLPQLPQVPTLAESNLDVGNLDLWYGFLAPKGTAAARIDRLNHEIAKIAAEPGFAAALEAQGIVPATSTPAGFGRLLVEEHARWTAVVERAGITGE